MMEWVLYNHITHSSHGMVSGGYIPLLLHCTEYAPEDTTSLSSMDSDLEAFSHFPTCDSFAAMSFQTTALPIARIKYKRESVYKYILNIMNIMKQEREMKEKNEEEKYY